MKRQGTFILIVILIFSAVLPLLAGDDGDQKSSGLLNGRAWATLSRLAKDAYLAGLMDGVFITTKTLKAEQQPPEFTLSGNLALLEVARQIDLFYADPSHLPIPILWSFTYVAKKSRGATAAELDDYVADLRKQFNN
ncbi:MAG TPA: hypothetical protein VMW38_05885 [Terriglobia bacterium]|nr:hypothetical protein [Terriglobia bacterium]